MKLFDLGENATRSLTEQGGDRRQDVTTALLLKELDCTSLNKWIRDGNREFIFSFRAHPYLHRSKCVKHIA